MTKTGRPTKLTEDFIEVAKEVFRYCFNRVDDKDKMEFIFWFRENFIFDRQRRQDRGIKFINRSQYQKEYYHKVISKCPKKRLRNSISALIRYHLRGKKDESVNNILNNHLGYGFDELRQHIESQFTGEMNWENYGEWHIDHIIPVSSFNFTNHKDKEFKECWALNNLQPLWAMDNFKKGNRLCVQQ